MNDARSGRVGAVVVWALDRLDRSMVSCVNRVLELDRIGVPVLSVREPWLDGSGPVRSLASGVKRSPRLGGGPGKDRRGGCRGRAS